MQKHYLFLTLFLALIFSSCNSEGSQKTAEAKDDMAQFSEDEEFKESHEQPTEINFMGKGRMLEFNTVDGETAKGYLLTPERKTDKVLFVIHEWWGLNDQIKKEAQRLFDSLENVTVLALDLYDGKVATTQENASKLMQSVQPERAESIIRGAIGLMGTNAKIATVGWCFGGGWSLKASIIAGNQGAGCVIYYGMPVQEPNEIAPLKADILGIFANQDGWITPEVVTNFEDLANQAGKNLEVHQFDAEHAFANPSSPRYKEDAAQVANQVVLSFLQSRL